MKIITNEIIDKFENYLVNEEKSAATVEKYVRDITAFALWLNGRKIDKRSFYRRMCRLCL